MKNGDYILVKAPEGYPGKKYRDRYCYEHHLAWWTNTGEKVEIGECVHHKDENKHNNEFSNLEKVLIVDHVTQHSTGRNTKERVDCTCPRCDAKFDMLKSMLNHRRKMYGDSFNPCCSRACQIQQQVISGNHPAKRLSDEKIEEIILYKANGKTMYRAAKDLSLSDATIKKYWDC